MADEKNVKFVHIQKYSDFLTKKIGADADNTTYTLGDSSEIYNGTPDISYYTIIYIKDNKKVFTHNGCYDCQEHAFYNKRYDFDYSSAFSELTQTNVTYDADNKVVICASGSTITLTFPRNTRYFVSLKVKEASEGAYVTVNETNYGLTSGKVTSFYVEGVFSTTLTFSDETKLDYITIQETDLVIPTKLSQLTNDVGYLVGETENETLKLIVK